MLAFLKRFQTSLCFVKMLFCMSNGCGFAFAPFSFNPIFSSFLYDKVSGIVISLACFLQNNIDATDKPSTIVIRMIDGNSGMVGVGEGEGVGVEEGRGT